MSARSRGEVAANSGWAATAASSADLPSSGDASATAQSVSTGGGVGNVERASVGCVDPLAVDEQSLLDPLDDRGLGLFAHI